MSLHTQREGTCGVDYDPGVLRWFGLRLDRTWFFHACLRLQQRRLGRLGNLFGCRFFRDIGSRRCGSDRRQPRHLSCDIRRAVACCDAIVHRRTGSGHHRAGEATTAGTFGTVTGPNIIAAGGRMLAAAGYQDAVSRCATSPRAIGALHPAIRVHGYSSRGTFEAGSRTCQTEGDQHDGSPVEVSHSDTPFLFSHTCSVAMRTLRMWSPDGRQRKHCSQSVARQTRVLFFCTLVRDCLPHPLA